MDGFDIYIYIYTMVFVISICSDVFDWLFHGILVILLWIWMDMANLARRWCVCVCENWVLVSQPFPANPSEHIPNFGERFGKWGWKAT